MKNINHIFYLSLTSFLILILLSSCSEIGLLSEKNSYVVEDITDFSTFISVYIVLQISILLISLLLSLVFGKAGGDLSLLLHFIWVVNYRDYGFFIVLLLFGAFTIIIKMLIFSIFTNKPDNY